MSMTRIKFKSNNPSMESSSGSDISSESLDLIYNHVSPSDFKKVRRKHAMAGLYLSGFLDAKVPSKSRPFGPWKTWKTQWCMIRRNGTHLEIQIGSTRDQISHNIHIPQDTVICRTESRSQPYAFGIFQYSDSKKSNRRASVYLAGHSETETQKWMGIMRDILRPPIHQVTDSEFSVSLIDNEFTRSSGLSGLYGNLSQKEGNLIIRDPHTNQIKVSWNWRHLQKFQVMSSACTEDFQRVIVIYTNCEFPKGMGALKLFCLQGYDLYEKLIKCQRSVSSTRLLSSPLPPIPRHGSESPPATPPRSLLMSRRMSRSENDLQKAFLQSSFLKLRSHGNSPYRNGTRDEFGVINKSSSNLMLNSPGVFMSTPGQSEPESLNDYECLDRRILSEKLNNLIIEEKEDSSDEDKISTASSSSDTYEEISHLLPPDDEEPPPLPPRPPKQFLGPPDSFPIGEMRKRSISTPVSPVTFKKVNRPLDRIDTMSLSGGYLPMDPSLSKHKMTPLQQSYVYMANLTNTSKIIVSEPVPI